MTAEETLDLVAKQWCTLEDIMKLGHLGRNSALKAKKTIKDKLERLAGKTDSTSKTNNTMLDTDSKEKLDDTFRETPVENNSKEQYSQGVEVVNQTEVKDKGNDYVQDSNNKSDNPELHYLDRNIGPNQFKVDSPVDLTTISIAKQKLQDIVLESDPEVGMPF